MKNYKKISALLSVIILLSQLMLPVGFAERVATDENAQSEVLTEEKYMISDVHGKEFTALYNIGIIKGNAEIDRLVTRGEFADILCSINAPYIDGTLGFRDIDPDSDIAKKIKSVTEYGYMSGFGDGTFRPDEPITYTEVVFALLKMAGYEELADLKGGYPNGYLSLAGEKKLNYANESEVTYSDMVRILYNYLKMNVIKMTAQTNNDKDLYESEITVLEEFMDLYEGKGIVYANEHIAIKGRKKTTKGKAVVEYDGKESTIEVGNSGIEDYVGYYVKYYFNENDEIIFAEPYEAKFEELVIKEESFYSIDRNLSRIEFESEEKTRGGYANISDNADFVYNGVSAYEITQDDFNSADYVRLIDNNMDGKYDVVYLYVYKSYMVKNVSYKEKIIQDQRDNVYYVFDESNAEVIYEKGGIKTDISLIKEWDVLNIQESKDINDRVIKVNIFSGIISGEVEGVNHDKRILTVGGEEYYISKKIDIATILNGTDIIAGLNEFGAVVCIKTYKKEREYAYLTKIIRDEAEDAISIKVINQSGKEEIIEFSEKFYINNQRATWDSLVPYIANYDPASGGYGNFRANYQLIAYKTKNDGKLARLYTSEEVKGARDELYNGELILNKRFTNARIRTQFPTINAEYVYEKNTPFFIIVTDSTTNEVVLEHCAIKTRDTLNITEGGRPSMKVYDAGIERVAKAVVIELKLAEVSGLFDVSSRQGFLVTEIRSVLNEDNEAVKEYIGISNGAETSYRQNEFYDFADWKVGDLWVVKRDVNNHVTGATKLFELKSEPGSDVMSPDRDYSQTRAVWDLNNKAGTNDQTETHTGVYGTLKSVINTDSMQAIRITPAGSTEDVVYGVNGTSITIYRGGKAFEPISFDNVSVGIGSGKIFCYTRYGICRDIIIIE